MSPQRGEIWYANLNSIRGSEQAGERPVLVIQNDAINRFTATVLAIPLTTNLRRARLPSCVQVTEGEGGLPSDSVILCHQMRVLDAARLFLNCYGRGLSKHAVEATVRRYTRQAGLRKRISPHCSRVTCVTGMLRNGADVRYLEEMLGHRDVSTLDPYLKLTVNELKEMHARFHPRERPEP